MSYTEQAYAAGTFFVADSTTGPTDLIHAYDATTGAAIAPDISLLGVTGLTIGPNGNLFAVTNNPGFQLDQGSVYQYDPVTHAKIGGPYVTFNGQNDGHDVQGPEGMQFGATGNLYVADVTESEVHVYGSANNSIDRLTSVQLGQPTDIAFDTTGNLYVVSNNADILRSAGGTGALTEFVPQLSGGLINPSSLDFGPDGKLYVLDNNSTPVVHRYDSTGAFDTDVISFSGNLGSFFPTQIAFGPDGKLYISGQDENVGDGEVLRFETDGTEDGPFVTGLQNPSFMAFTAVPEPATIISFVIGGASLMLIARRRRFSVRV
ncbi:MAG TPA: PEP-CTERM sorting domain-containing protein [Pirellulales bacterium]